MAHKTGVALRREWRLRLERFARSNVSVAEFCRRERVSAPSFYQWRKKLGVTDRNGQKTMPAKALFLPVQVAGAGGVQFAFPNGATLTLPVEEDRLIRLSIEAVAQVRTHRGDA